MPVLVHGGGGYLDRDLGPVAAQCLDGELTAKHATLPRRAQPLEPGQVEDAMALGDDQIDERPSDRLGAREAEQLLGARVPLEHAALGIEADERVVSDLEDGLGRRRPHDGAVSSAASIASIVWPVDRKWIAPIPSSRAASQLTSTSSMNSVAAAGLPRRSSVIS